ncbi:MAG TPA: hypothetical protein VFH61_14075 [Thermoleophilia bacterium]|nr:hypothetical protein [Thermoleophilia bacterium]
MSDLQELKKDPGLISHTHCPGCGEHFRAVGKLMDLGSKKWICGRCVAREKVQNANLVVVNCPACEGVAAVGGCPKCKGFGSVRVPEGELAIYRPGAPRVLTDDAPAG